MAMVLLVWSPVWSESLREVLTKYGITKARLKNPDAAVLNPTVINSPDIFCIGFFPQEPSREMHLALLDRRNLRWYETEIDLEEPEFCFGSNAITGMQHAGTLILLETHINPSAACTYIFNLRLQFQKTLYGWPLAIFADGTVLYENSGIHFAPTHPAKISVYNPNTQSERTIYPMKPYRTIRLRHIERMKAHYGDENWCRENNHHCDPDLFDNSIGDLAFHDETDSLIFQVRFTGDYGVEPPVEVVYVYRHVRDPERIEYREILEQDLRDVYGDHSFSRYLQPDILSRIFRSP